MNLESIERLSDAINGQQHWLTLSTERSGDGTLLLVADIHGHFASPAESDSPEAFRDALTALFDTLAEHVRSPSAPGGVVGQEVAAAG